MATVEVEKNGNAMNAPTPTTPLIETTAPTIPTPTKDTKIVVDAANTQNSETKKEEAPTQNTENPAPKETSTPPSSNTPTPTNTETKVTPLPAIEESKQSELNTTKPTENIPTPKAQETPSSENLTTDNIDNISTNTTPSITNEKTPEENNTATTTTSASLPTSSSPFENKNQNAEDLKALINAQTEEEDIAALTQQMKKMDPAYSPENDTEGNIEYKLKLVAPSPTRFEHLVSQLKWRLGEGMGEAIYEVGVEDNGSPTGLTEEDMKASLETLAKMAEQLGADMTTIREREGASGKVAEVLIRRYAREDFLEVRVAVVGNVDSGKSTLLGVLTKGGLDNGRGLARQMVFRHKHEIESGRTSSISQEIMGFDSRGRVVNYSAVHAALAPQEVTELSAKIINFIDLAGHEKYLRTTLFGMTGHAPDFAMLMIGANMGVVGMTKEHLGITLALRVPVFIVVTKIDMCPENILKETMADIKKILKSPGSRKIPVVIRNEDDVVVAARNFVSERIAPIFCVSNVSGVNLNLLRTFLNLLPARRNWEDLASQPTHFDIDSTWSVTGVGTVISGTVMTGTITVNDTFLLGPDQVGEFVPVTIKSIHTKRLPVKQVRAGQTASLALKKIKRAGLRKGMCLVHPSVKPVAVREFEAEILVLYHSTTIQRGYEAVVHCGTTQQCARILDMDKDAIRMGDKCKVRFRFQARPEFLQLGSRLIFREGKAKGIGRVTQLFTTPAPVPGASASAGTEAAPPPVKLSSDHSKRAAGPSSSSSTVPTVSRRIAKRAAPAKS
eukprot:TRINITY_DN8428_c0_g2_i1.p1 TRINITY_DN8428_c0_g2~~TRINITY_DN8428_c0_g2_i1.p1  ORF type:complete len:786 (-),score=195.73 TRINITY_DN8428_c0_g2_i1:107-2464(-)